MLEIHIINVSDGDSILVRKISEGHEFDMLIDAGRAELTSEPGSLRILASDYLKRLGIDHLDLLIVTHLHVDHYAGLANIIPGVTTDRVISPFYPEDGKRVMLTSDVKTINDLKNCLNGWADIVERLRQTTTVIETIEETTSYSIGSDLSMDIICCHPDALKRQVSIFNDMFDGRDCTYDDLYWASKSRNSLSLRIRIHYAGREIELSGDCFCSGWEESGKRPCDIWKIPHHGDIKSLSPDVVEALNAPYAVISCEMGYNEKKDRPSMHTIDLLRENGARIWFTDSYEAPWYNDIRHSAVVFTIDDDGTIHIPE